MIQALREPVAIFLTIMAVVLITPMLSERVRLPGIVGIILGGMLVGPYVLNLLSPESGIEFLATIGLVYLMFTAGLEVDIRQFTRVRGRAAIFGLLTYFTPQIMGTALGRLLGLDWLGAVLLGSAFSSHTLIAFPILSRLGVVRNEAVSVTVGATVMTDIGAFVVLAAVLGLRQGNLELGYFIRLGVMLVIYTLLILYGLPRLGKFIFHRLKGRAVEFQFVLLILFISALLAELIGVHEVVGAFLAGLAVNTTLPRRSPVVGHVLFLGESFFIPVFLLYSGMITNPMVFLKSGAVILVALAVTCVAYVSKLVAAWITARIFRYTRSEFWVAYGLSHAQAAVTIPTLVIGLQQGLFNETLFNSAIMMILLTSITSPLLVQKFARKLSAEEPQPEASPFFRRILVPIINPQNQENRLVLASILARAHGGTILAVHVSPEVDGRVREPAPREPLEHIPDILGDPETNLQLIPRVDHSAAQGIIHTAMENNASVILMGWRGRSTIRSSIMGAVLDEVIWGTDIPVMVGRLNAPINGTQQVVLLLPSESLSQIVARRALDMVTTVTTALNAPLLVLSDGEYHHKIEQMLAGGSLPQGYRIEALGSNPMKTLQQQTSDQDMIVIPSVGSRKRFLSSLGNLPERVAAETSCNLVILHYRF